MAVRKAGGETPAKAGFAREAAEKDCRVGVDDIDGSIGTIGEVVGLGCLVYPADIKEYRPPAVLLPSARPGTGMILSNLTAA